MVKVYFSGNFWGGFWRFLVECQGDFGVFLSEFLSNR